MKFLILDGSSLIYRAFYALPLLHTAKGDYTNAIFGFSTMLVRLLKDFDPDCVCNCLDASRKTFRTELFPDYKATRDKTPAELLSQIEPIKELCASLGIKNISIQNFEADDLIGTLAVQAADSEIDTAIVTGDRDSLQLLRKNLRVFFTKKGTQNLKVYNEETFLEEFKFQPRQLIDFKALQGDKSDNIPGIPTIGEKTAANLLISHDNLENIFANINEIQPKKVRDKLIAFEDQARLSKQLATINCHVPDLKFDPNEFKLQVDFSRLAEFCRRYELNKPLKQFHDLFAFRLNFDLSQQNQANLFDYESESTSEAVDSVQDENITYVRDLKSLLHREPEIESQLSNFFDISLANYLLYPDDSSRSKKIPERLNSEQMLQLGRKLKSSLESENLVQLYEKIELPLIPVLARMEKIGVLVDKSQIREKSLEIGKQINELIEEIYFLADEKFNINSTHQLGRILFEKLQLPPTKKTKTGYSTDVEVLESLKSQHPIIEKILDYRMLTKMKSTYLDGISALINPRTGRVHTKFHQTIAATGRLSSSDPNLQNVPIRTEIGRSIRALFIPGENFDYLLSADYSQIELRLLAHMSSDENFIRSFLSNEDIHARTAAEVFNVKIEEVNSDLRRRAKAVNFGIVYGISDYGLSKDLHISRKEAGEYISKFYERYSGVKNFLDDTIAFARENGYTQTLFGRKRQLPAISSPNFYTRSVAERMAMNSPIQGTAADIIKLAMIRVDDRLRRENLQSRIILQVHDELVFEVTTDEIESVEKIIHDEMEHVVELKIPLPVDIHIGKNWAEAK